MFIRKEYFKLFISVILFIVSISNYAFGSTNSPALKPFFINTVTMGNKALDGVEVKIIGSTGTYQGVTAISGSDATVKLQVVEGKYIVRLSKIGYPVTYFELEVSQNTAGHTYLLPSWEQITDVFGISADQSKAMILGKITDQSGKPIGKATVSISPESGAKYIVNDNLKPDSGFVTRDNGEFIITNIENNTYSLNVTHKKMSFAPYQINITQPAVYFIRIKAF